jgi:quinol monooxygenase YgiN
MGAVTGDCSTLERSSISCAVGGADLPRLDSMVSVAGEDGRAGQLLDRKLITPPRAEQDGLSWCVTGQLSLFFTTEFGESQAFVVMARWPVASGSEAEFTVAAHRNARSSVELEPGCLAFGILASAEDSCEFALVEVFTHGGAFEEHLSTEHFQRFSAVARPIFVGDRAQTLKGEGAVHFR